MTEMTEIIRHLPLVQRIAGKLCRNNYRLSFDDAVQNGFLGLIDAWKRYEPEKETPFEFYAGIRIRGTILDKGRYESSNSRSKVEFSKKLQRATELCEQKLSGPCSNRDIAEKLGITIDDLEHKRRKYSVTEIAVDSVSDRLDSLLLETAVSRNDPLLQVISNEERSLLKKALAELTSRELSVYHLYFEQDLSLKEVGGLINLSESRVSQIMSKITQKLKDTVEIA